MVSHHECWRDREVEMEFLKEGETTFDCNIPSVKKGFGPL